MEINTITATSCNEVENIFNENNTPLNLGVPIYFRGQKNINWNIKPSIARTLDSKYELEKIEKNNLTNFKSGLEAIDEIEIIRTAIKAGEYIRPFQDQWEWSSQAQHLGLRTRLLDWTESWKIGLYFAVEEDNENDFQDGVLFFLKKFPIKHCCQEAICNISLYEIKKEDFYMINFSYSLDDSDNDYRKYLGERNKEGQFGTFLVQSSFYSLIPLELRFSELLTKIRIPYSCKKLIREGLKDLKIERNKVYFGENAKVQNLINAINNGNFFNNNAPLE